MMAWAPPDEVFVKVPGIVEICWKSDDPLFYREPVDLYDEQRKGQGLSENHGKKDKQTSEQSYFKCHPCECDLMSVITLRAHCNGSKHITKAVSLEVEYEKKRAKGAVSPVEEQEERGGSVCDLYSALLKKEGSSIVGLRYITEYLDGEDGKGRKPLYHCSLPDCRNAYGDATFMCRHIFQLVHRGSWMKESTGLYEQSYEAVLNYVNSNSEDLDRDYIRMKQVSDRDKYEECRKGDIRSSIEPRRTVKRERPKEFDRPSSPPGKRSPKRERPEVAEERFSDRSRSPARGRSSSRDRSAAAERLGDRGDTLVENSRRVKAEDGCEPGSEVELLRQRGTFNFRDVSSLKPDLGGTGDTPDSIQVLAAKTVERPVLSVEDIIQQFKRDVTECVKKNLNPHYPEAKEYDKYLRPITKEEYIALARSFSRDLRSKLKESYFDYNRTYEGLTLTEDFKYQIKCEIQSYFDRLP